MDRKQIELSYRYVMWYRAFPEERRHAYVTHDTIGEAHLTAIVAIA